MRSKTKLTLVLFLTGIYIWIMTSVMDTSTDTYGKEKEAKTPNHLVPFEPEVDEDFPTRASGDPIIPHIMHFIFISGDNEREGIPVQYFRNVIFFTSLNPDWTIYFWSDVTARMFISLKYPDFLPIWDYYPLVIHKADALRYFVLYEFGGVYSDLDAQFLRPLDRVTMKYACIISPEPFEHSSILYNRPLQLNNGFLLCRRQHPFMKQVITYLPEFARKDNVIEVAGPLFLTKQYLIYNHLTPVDLFRNKTDQDSNSPFFYKGHLPEDHPDAVYVPNTQYFMSVIDWGAPFEIFCYNFSSKFELVKRGCDILKDKATKPELHKYAFIDHQWTHAYSIDENEELLPIESLVPRTQLKIWQP